MPSHHLITDPYLHEPKGISSANEGMVYVANGSGTGNWIYWPYGKAFYQHDSVGQVIGTAASLLQINGLGTLTEIAHLPREIRGTGQLWDGVLNRITPIKQNDGYQVRIDIPVTLETGSPTELKVQLDIGTSAAPSNIILNRFLKTGRTVPYTLSFDTSLDILTSTTFANGIRFFLNVDVGSVTLGSPAIYITKISDGDL